MSASLIGYIGGKHFLVRTLLGLIPAHRVYVEVFGGGAHLLLNKEPSHIEVYNDINGDLVNLFTVVRDRPDDFVKAFDLWLYSRELRERYLREPMPTDPVERAARFFFLIESSFSGDIHGGMKGTGGKVKNEARTFFRKLQRIHEISRRLRNVFIERRDFREIIKLYDSKDTFFYCDPPYWEAQSFEYQYDFTEKDHVDLWDLLRRIKGKFLLTYGDSSIIRALYKDFYFFHGGRIARGSKSLGTMKKAFKHLIIMNYI